MSKFTRSNSLEYTSDLQSSNPGEPVTPNPPPPGKGFVQMFGLDPRAAGLAVIVDFLVFGGDIVSMGLLYPVEIIAGVLLTFITYKIQRAWYGDDHDSALIKAMIVGGLTSIPIPITAVIAGPQGLLGLIRLARGKK